MPVLDHPLRAARAPLFACAAALLGGACVPGEGSLTLSWPNEEARAATKQLAVFAFTADTGAGRRRARSSAGTRSTRRSTMARAPTATRSSASSRRSRSILRS